MSDLKYIYWFAYYNEDSPSVRYRGKYPLEFFEENHGIKSKLIIPSYRPKRILAFAGAYFSLLFLSKRNSLIVIQRVHSNFIYSSLLKLVVLIHRKKTVYDLDDADYLYCKPNTIFFFSKKCHVISAGSNAIADYLSKFNQNIVVTPSPTPDRSIVKQKRNDLFTIGWIGGFGGDHKKSMIEIVFPAIRQLSFPCKFILLGVTKQKDLVFIREYFLQYDHIQVEIPNAIDWRNETWIQETISSFDIGIATLLDNEIQRSKSGIKAKQYLNNGVPVLGTHLPENDWVIQHGVNGYFCSNSSEFEQRMNEFKTMSEEEYELFSQNARASIVHFNHELYHQKFNEIAAFS